MTGSIESSTAVRFEYSNCAPNTGTWANCISHSNEPEDPCESRARWIRRHDLRHSCATLRLARGVQHGETGMRRSGHCTVKEREPVLTLALVALLCREPAWRIPPGQSRARSPRNNSSVRGRGPHRRTLPIRGRPGRSSPRQPGPGAPVPKPRTPAAGRRDNRLS